MKNKNNTSAIYEQQEARLTQRSEQFIDMLTKRGIVEDRQINDDKIRKAVKEKKRIQYHNTLLMLQNYRDITWALECFPANVAAELDRPLENLDALLSAIDAEMGLGNQKLENRLESIKKSRLMLDRLNEALTILRQKPTNGELMYQAMYLTFIVPEKHTIAEIVYRMGICTRHYYRIRAQAINILSLRLWATTTNEIDAWIEIMTLLDAL